MRRKVLVVLTFSSIVILTMLGMVSTPKGFTPPLSMVKTQTHISWVDLIQVNGITYMATENTVPEQNLDTEYSKINFKTAGNISDPEYRIKDGDATFIEAGTPVYKVKGYNPEFCLAAERGAMFLYVADTNPRAKTGGDLLDIRDKISYIAVEEDGKANKTTIKDQNSIKQLEDLILSAPVNQNQDHRNSARYSISFHLKDDTVITRNYWPENRELSRGILLPSAFEKILLQ